MTSATLLTDTSLWAQIATSPTSAPPIPPCPRVALGPVQSRVIHAAHAFDRPSSFMDEAERWLRSTEQRERAFDDEADADAAYLEEEPQAPEACVSIDVNGGRRRLMSRDEMMEHVERDWGGSGAIWLERVLAYDHWQLECFQLKAKHKLPQLQARAKLCAETASATTWSVLSKPTHSVREVALKLAIFMVEVGEVELSEDVAKPLRQVCAELLASTSSAAT